MIFLSLFLYTSYISDAFQKHNHNGWDKKFQLWEISLQLF